MAGRFGALVILLAALGCGDRHGSADAAPAGDAHRDVADEAATLAEHCRGLVTEWAQIVAGVSRQCSRNADCRVVGRPRMGVNPAGCECAWSVSGTCGLGVNEASYLATRAFDLDVQFGTECWELPFGAGLTGICDCGLGWAGCFDGSCAAGGFGCCNPPPWDAGFSCPQPPAEPDGG